MEKLCEYPNYTRHHPMSFFLWIIHEGINGWKRHNATERKANAPSTELPREFGSVHCTEQCTGVSCLKMLGNKSKLFGDMSCVANFQQYQRPMTVEGKRNLCNRFLSGLPLKPSTLDRFASYRLYGPPVNQGWQ